MLAVFTLVSGFEKFFEAFKLLSGDPTLDHRTLLRLALASRRQMRKAPIKNHLKKWLTVLFVRGNTAREMSLYITPAVPGAVGSGSSVKLRPFEVMVTNSPSFGLQIWSIRRNVPRRLQGRSGCRWSLPMDPSGLTVFIDVFIDEVALGIGIEKFSVGTHMRIGVDFRTHCIAGINANFARELPWRRNIRVQRPSHEESGAHVSLTQLSLKQSPSARHDSASAHWLPDVPPQSTSVSSPF